MVSLAPKPTWPHDHYRIVKAKLAYRMYTGYSTTVYSLQRSNGWYPNGTTSWEPICDEQGRQLIFPTYDQALDYLGRLSEARTLRTAGERR